LLKLPTDIPIRPNSGPFGRGDVKRTSKILLKGTTFILDVEGKSYAHWNMTLEYSKTLLKLFWSHVLGFLEER